MYILGSVHFPDNTFDRHGDTTLVRQYKIVLQINVSKNIQNFNKILYYYYYL